MRPTEQTRAIKKSLKEMGYRCSVRKGPVTWIDIDIQDRPQTPAALDEVMMIAAMASERDKWPDKDLSVEFTFRPFIPTVCPACGSTGTDINRYLCADDIIRDHCRNCGKVY